MRCVRLTRFVAACLALNGMVGFAMGQDVDQEQPVASVPAPYGECALGYWSSNRNLDDVKDVANSFCILNWKPKLSTGASLGFNARLDWQYQPSSVNTRHRMREAYLDVEEGAFSMRLGRQILAWGRADRINPTDSLSPRDFTLLVTEDEDQRTGMDAARFRYALDPALFFTVVAARFEPNITPQGSLPANRVNAAAPDQTEWAFKLDHSGSGIDWSLSYFEGYERQGRYRFDSRPTHAPVFRSDFEKMQTFGADFAGTAGAWTWRGEVSHSTTRAVCDLCPLDARKVSRAVVGVDRDFLDTMNVNLQLFTTTRTGYRDPGSLPAAMQPILSGLNRLNSEYGAQETGLTVRLSDRLLNEKLKWEISAVFDLTGRSRVIRPRVTYAMSDHIKLNAGIDFFSGDAQSYFGALDKNTLGFVVLSLVF